MEALGGLVVPVQVVEHDGTVHEGFGIAIVDFERLIELFEGTLGIPHHGQAQPRPIAYVGEVGMVLKDGAKVLEGSRKVVLLPGRISEAHHLSNRRVPGLGIRGHSSGARNRRLLFPSQDSPS